MSTNPSTLLRRLERVRDQYSSGAESKKHDLLNMLHSANLTRAAEVLRLHEALCFLDAYPDSPEIFDRVGAMLSNFDQRKDLLRHRIDLGNSGIVGTEITYRFFWPTARWIAHRWPEQMHIDWEEFEKADRLVEVLHLLLPYFATPAIDTLEFEAREWIERVKSDKETDAAFVVRRFETLPTDSFTREWLYDSLDIPIRIDPGVDTPERSRARVGSSRVIYQRTPLRRQRPDLAEAVQESVSVKSLPPREGAAILDLTREAMVTRNRDLDAFANGDARDVRLIDCGDGLEFACIGVLPERRLLIESSYGFLTLHNGVPIGYVLASSLFRSSEIAFNVFDSFRGAEAAHVFARLLAAVRQIFGAEAFSIDPFQLGYGNAEGLESGAWWFYYKLGFRPDNPEIRQLVDRELKRIETDPSYRSDEETLEELASDYLFWVMNRSRTRIMGRVALGNIALRVASHAAETLSGYRDTVVQTASRKAMHLLGLRSLNGLDEGQRLTWERWSPLVLALPGLKRWTKEEKNQLVEVILAKGGRCESDYVTRFDAHARLRRAVLSLAAPVDPD